jgi:lipid-A-disaccharide synthase
MEELAVMGLVEVLSRLPRLLAIKKSLINSLKQIKPIVYIGIDAPDFNLRIELALKRAGIKTVHYVSPSVWAWREKRVFNIAKATNLVLSLLPFEKAFYDKYDIPCRFVGHPLADEIPLESQQENARVSLAIPIDGKLLAVMPGSRGGELAKLTAPFLMIAQQLKDAHPELQFIVPVNNETRLAQFERIKTIVAPDLPMKIVVGQSQVVMAAADVLLMSSGTATLEAALHKKPTVVGYILNGLTYAIVKRMYKPKYISLPNILANQELMPEFMQDSVNADVGKGTMYDAVEQRLYQEQPKLTSAFIDIHNQLKQNAGEQAALAVIELINHD